MARRGRKSKGLATVSPQAAYVRAGSAGLAGCPTTAVTPPGGRKLAPEAGKPAAAGAGRAGGLLM